MLDFRQLRHEGEFEFSPLAKSKPESLLHHLCSNLKSQRLSLEHVQQQQNNHNQHKQTEAAAWSIAPIAAVWPSRHRAEKQKYQNYQ